MSESFSVGEIAIYVGTWSQIYGTECEIIGDLEMRSGIFSDGTRDTGLKYRIRRCDGQTHQVYPKHLRKRPPKQDWKTLCNLTDTPREVTCA